MEGYADAILSPILDFPEIYRTILGGIRRGDLADPAFYARLREALDRVELAFSMKRRDRSSAEEPHAVRR